MTIFDDGTVSDIALAVFQWIFFFMGIFLAALMAVFMYSSESLLKTSTYFRDIRNGKEEKAET